MSAYWYKCCWDLGRHPTTTLSGFHSSHNAQTKESLHLTRRWHNDFSDMPCLDLNISTVCWPLFTIIWIQSYIFGSWGSPTSYMLPQRLLLDKHKYLRHSSVKRQSHGEIKYSRSHWYYGATNGKQSQSGSHASEIITITRQLLSIKPNETVYMRESCMWRLCPLMKWAVGSAAVWPIQAQKLLL